MVNMQSYQYNIIYDTVDTIMASYSAYKTYKVITRKNL